METNERELKWGRSTAGAKRRQILEAQIADLQQAFENGDSPTAISELSRMNTELQRTVRELRVRLSGMDREFESHIRGIRIRYDESIKDRDHLREQLMWLRAMVSR